ncbi:MAG TPA: biopolymer transporter Tol [Propionicimonas sp.]|nr:biopolymer transporter Tol [Propionicimonas sp.]
MAGRELAAGQVCEVHTYDLRTATDSVVYVDTERLFEAPNWTPDDRLILNGDGLLWTLPADGSAPPTEIPLVGAPELNNDHVLAPDGENIYLSGNDRHLYVAPLAGGETRRVTRDRGSLMHFLHGVSPDGTTLAYVNIDPTQGWGCVNLHTVGVDGSDDREVLPGWGPDDGPEYSVDGEWLYFNTERFSTTPGHAQIARVRPDGTEFTQLTFDERVNWFPHTAPGGRHWVYLSFPAGTLGHPADLTVQLRLVVRDAWADAVTVAELPGGQGTINVNSWSPDGTRFAYVAYPFR